jgi:hypothetical protein
VVTFNLFHGGPSSGLVGDGEALEERLDPRVLLRADVRTPWGELAVFSTHVSRDDCQVARVGEIVREHAKGQPAVLMGDFNVGETSMAIQALNGHGGFVLWPSDHYGVLAELRLFGIQCAP